MEIILLEKIERLGTLGDVVDVRPGYARNYLIPSGKAKYATEANLAEVQVRREELERKAIETLSFAEQRKVQLDGFNVTVAVEINQEGKLFGSVGVGEIARKVTEAGAKLERHEIRLPDGPLHSLGEHSVAVRLHSGVEAVVNVSVESSGVIETPVELEEEAEPETDNPTLPQEEIPTESEPTA